MSGRRREVFAPEPSSHARGIVSAEWLRWIVRCYVPPGWRRTFARRHMFGCRGWLVDVRARVGDRRWDMRVFCPDAWPLAMVEREFVRIADEVDRTIPERNKARRALPPSPEWPRGNGEKPPQP